MAGRERERNPELVLAKRMQKIVSKCLYKLEKKEPGALDSLDGVKSKDLANIAATLMSGALAIKEKVVPQPDGIFEMTRSELLEELAGKKKQKEENVNLIEKSTDFESAKKNEKNKKTNYEKSEKESRLKNILKNE
jgi:hypothetical protein